MLASLDPEPLAPLPERIRELWRLSVSGYLLCSVGLVLIIFTGEVSATDSLESALGWALICMVAIAAGSMFIGAVFLLTPLRHRRTRQVSAWWTIGGVIVGVCLIGVVTSWGADLLGVPTTLDFWPRLIAMTVLGSALGLAALLFLDRTVHTQRNLTRLAEQQVNNELAQMSQVLLLQEIRVEVMNQIDEELDSARDQVQHLLREVEDATSAASMSMASAELLAMADGSIRPLSARLWSTAGTDQPKASLWSLISETLRHEPFHPVALILIHLMGSTALSITQFGAGNALGLALSSTLTIAVITLTANALMRRCPTRHALIFVLGIVVLQLGVIPTALWRNNQIPGSASMGWIVLQIVAGVLVIFATSGIGTWWRVRDALVQERGRVLSREQAHALARSRIVADLARETSKVLHGSVQTRLVACAMSTERAIVNNDIVQLKEALVEASRILDQESFQQDPVSSLRQEIDRKVQLWVELCDIRVHVDPLLLEADMDLAARSATASTVGRVIEEAMSNAIRHGDANAIVVQVDLMPDGTIRVVVTDNGAGVASNPPGMGSAFLTQATRGAWSLDQVAGGACLTAYVSTSLTSP